MFREVDKASAIGQANMILFRVDFDFKIVVMELVFE